ncbi:inorganic phosphate transporter [Natronoarchaeum rubrum]|uniref:inorganic phosphate transporter n=1 Tax=Natronoarchaeum rubrum TaxID=755311 RepID=UPI0021136448|nr:inorganic phosphate transporter [Natronoarchaeum rubrum]
MVTALLVVGLFVAAFVGYNIGGSSTGVAFGPAVGSRIVGKVTAAALFTVFALLGGWTVGRNVIDTMSSQIVPASQFTLATSVGVLFFAGASLLLSNLYGVPASTSMTSVGAIVGLGIATGSLNEAIMFRIVSAWIVAPLSAFLVGMVIGRYLYPHLDARFTFTRLESSLIRFDRTGAIPRPAFNDRATPRDILGSGLVLVIACYMGFSAGASNAANAVAPLVGNGSISVEQGILLAIGAIGLGGFTIARRTLATVGDGITDLPILAALIVSSVGATIITILSQLGIPASLAVSTTCCIIGLGWGRASRAVTLAEAASVATDPDVAQLDADAGPELSTGALGAESADDSPPSGPTVGTLAGTEAEQQAEAEQRQEVIEESDDAEVAPIGEEELDELAAESLFDPAATSRIVFLWVLTPTLSAIGAYVLFLLVL